MAKNPLADDAEAEILLRDAAAGDAAALRRLLARHRDRLRRMVALRLNSRLAARVDPSEVVHEAFSAAETGLVDYVRDRPMPFYAWLHRLAAERLESIRRRLMPTEAGDGPLEASDTLATAALSVARVVAPGDDDDTSSGPAPLFQEDRRRVRAALENLAPPDREILILHYLEELDFTEMAAILGLDARAVKKRHLQALQRMSKFLGDAGGESGGRS